MIEPLEPRQHLDGGQLDATFGTDGKASIDFSSVLSPGVHASIAAIAEDRRDNVYVIGGDSNVSAPQLLIARLTHDGELDDRFGIDGIVALPRHFEQTPQIAIDSSNRIYVRDESRLYRLSRTGRFDQTFAHGGKLTVPRMETPFDMQTDDDGHVYLFGTDTTAIRLTENGKLDKSWANGGVFQDSSPGNSGNIKGAAVLNDGRIVLAVESPFEGSELEGIRLTPAGTIDPNYGIGGRAIKSDATNTLLFNSILPNGSIIGNQGVPIDPNDEQSDRTWSTFLISANGNAISAPNLIPSAIAAGRTIVPYRYVAPSGGKFISTFDDDVFQMESDGQLDPEFNGNGIAVVSGARDPTVSRDGRVLVATTDGSSVGVARLWRDDQPSVAIEAADITRAASRSIFFSVTWSDDDGIDASTIGSHDVFVNRPDGARQSAKLDSVSEVQPGVFRALYKFSAADGRWDVLDNGHYTILTRTGVVADVHGAENLGTTAGEFAVRIGQS